MYCCCMIVLDRIRTHTRIYVYEGIMNQSIMMCICLFLLLFDSKMKTKKTAVVVVVTSRNGWSRAFVSSLLVVWFRMHVLFVCMYVKHHHMIRPGSIYYDDDRQQQQSVTEQHRQQSVRGWSLNRQREGNLSLSHLQQQQTTILIIIFWLLLYGGTKVYLYISYI